MSRITEARIARATAYIELHAKDKGQTHDKLVKAVANEVFLRPNLFQRIFGIKPKFTELHRQEALKVASLCYKVIVTTNHNHKAELKRNLLSKHFDQVKKSTTEAQNKMVLKEIEGGQLQPSNVARWKALGIDLNGDKEHQLLAAAVAKCDLPVIKAMIDGGALVTADLLESVLKAKDPSLPLVTLLIGRGCDIPQNHSTLSKPIKAAINAGMELQQETFRLAANERDFDAFAVAFPGKSDEWILFKSIAFNNLDAFSFVAEALNKEGPLPTKCPFSLPGEKAPPSSLMEAAIKVKAYPIVRALKSYMTEEAIKEAAKKTSDPVIVSILTSGKKPNK